MKSETLSKINEALRRLEEGTYETALSAAKEIAGARLGAAICGEGLRRSRETAEQRERLQAQKRGGSTLFFDMSN